MCVCSMVSLRNMTVYLSVCLFACLYLSVCLFVYLFVCLFVYLFVCLFVYLFVCLSVCRGEYNARTPDSVRSKQVYVQPYIVLSGHWLLERSHPNGMIRTLISQTMCTIREYVFLGYIYYLSIPSKPELEVSNEVYVTPGVLIRACYTNYLKWFQLVIP